MTRLLLSPNCNQPISGREGWSYLLGRGWSDFPLYLPGHPFSTLRVGVNTHIPYSEEFGADFKPGPCLTVPPLGLTLPKLDQGSTFLSSLARAKNES